MTANEQQMLIALRAFVEQAEKVRGFPHLVSPYLGPLVMARAIVRKADAQIAHEASK